MTGAEHYVQAELWTFKAEYADARGGTETAESCAAIAEVHATLALAAATALRVTSPEGMNSADKQAWREAAATPQKPRAVA